MGHRDTERTMNNRKGQGNLCLAFFSQEIETMNQTELAYLPIAELRKMSTEEIRIVFTCLACYRQPLRQGHDEL